MACRTDAQGELVKLHRYSGKVTYLVVPDLETSQQPEVALRVKVELPRLDVRVFDYSDRVERPRLDTSGRYQEPGG